MTLAGRLIVQATESLAVDEGGPAVVVGLIANSLAAGEAQSLVVEVDRVSGPRVAVNDGVIVSQRPCLPNDSALLHLHGLWRTAYARLAFSARRRPIPVVVSVHGMLDPWALGQRRVAKRVARFAYQDRVLRGASCLHVTSRTEADQARALGLSLPVAIVPLGVETLNEPLSTPASEPTWLDGPELGARVVLFMSRIHPKKGLDRLLQAWQRLGAVRDGWMLVIAGYDDGGHQAYLEAMSRQLSLDGCVRFAGPLEGCHKQVMLARADVFVLPSHSENFGLVVLEALAAGVPVIASRQTPWSELPAEGCGWWIDNDVESLACALHDAMATPPEELAAMGRAGRALVERRYGRQRFCEAIGHLYAWLLGAEEQPSSVLSRG